MAHHKQLPTIFKKLHPKWRTPWFGVLCIATLITIAILIFENNTDALLMLVISGASCYLLAYIITTKSVYQRSYIYCFNWSVCFYLGEIQNEKRII